MAAGASSADTPRSFRVRACDNCRLRKIKCDKSAPCSSCTVLGIPCSAGRGAPAAAAGPQRVQNDDYEQKFQAIQEQLNTIQQTLQQISASNPSQSPSATPAPAPVPTLAPFSPARQTVPPFEGQSSFHHETLVARDAALSAVVAARGGELNDQVSSALSSLKDSLNRDSTPGPAGPSSEARAREPLLPVDLVVAVVKKVKAHPPFFLVSQSWKETRQLESLCQSIYFPIEPIPAGATTLLHGLLYFLIRDYIHEGEPDLAHFDLSSSKTFCERNFSIGLNSPQILTDPTLEKVQALLIGITKAQEEFDVQRCWTYLSLAFNMCQTLGLHRNTTSHADPFPVAESKRHAFWSLYTIDKNVALNIGATSHFQDHDIDADFYTPSTDPRQRSWDLINLATVEFANIQGKVYDQLYSVSATRASEEERLGRVQALSMDLMALRNKLLETDITGAFHSASLHGWAACADFIAYSVMTVIYRAQTRAADAMAVSSQCYEAASMALHSHLKCITYFRDREKHKLREYVNSILLYPSFTPFIIVFTHAITTTSTADLALLLETVRSLELIKGVSRGSEHLHSICASFAKTAQVLVETRQTLTGLAQNDDGSLFMPAGSGVGDIALPVDVTWPEDLFEGDGLGPNGQVDISMFLNEFVGGRSGLDILRGGRFG
ncbi:transcription factor domain-containing protein [Aspergillus undulatus]|uniref:transcription factor domain-containing protein n=1 Tax=Aspergillus undulatus TaxID=1810928 RepID=UPI003CCCC512